MTNPRKPIRTASGLLLHGRWPQQMGASGEGPYIAALADHTSGACEVPLPVGRADVVSERIVFEVEPAKQWRTAVRQVLGYAGQTRLTPAIALFGPADYLRIYLFLRDRLPGVQLWIHRERWVWTTSRVSAKRKHNPTHDLHAA